MVCHVKNLKIKNNNFTLPKLLSQFLNSAKMLWLMRHNRNLHIVLHYYFNTWIKYDQPFLNIYLKQTLTILLHMFPWLDTFLYPG